MMRRLLSAVRWVADEGRMIVAELRAGSAPKPGLDQLPAPPAAPGRAVMLVPGLLSSDSNLAFVADWLRTGGYRVITSGIERNSSCPDALIDQLSRRLSTHLDPGEKALLIGHSKGGLLAMGIAHLAPQLVERVLALGSPLKDPFDLQWNTRVTVRTIAALKRVRGGARPGCYTSACSCEAMRLVTEQRVPPVPVTNVASRRDGIVRFESCLHPHVSVREVSAPHNSMPWEPEVVRIIVGWLGEDLQTGTAA